MTSSTSLSSPGRSFLVRARKVTSFTASLGCMEFKEKIHIRLVPGCPAHSKRSLGFSDYYIVIPTEASMTLTIPDLQAAPRLTSAARPALLFFNPSNEVIGSHGSLHLDVFLHLSESSSLLKVKCHLLLTPALVLDSQPPEL